MRPYGLNEFGMRGCCPGHDDFPKESYKSRRSIKSHKVKTKIMRRRERRLEKIKLKTKHFDKIYESEKNNEK